MKQTLLLYIFLIMSITCNAQKVVPTPIDPNKVLQEIGAMTPDASISLLTSSLRQAFILSRQSFQVSDKKTGELYGLNNHDEFGIEISLGVKVTEGYILTDRAIRPWEYNPKYDTYRENYAPVLYQSHFSEIGGKAKYDTLVISKENTTEIEAKSLYLIKNHTPNFKGLNIDNTEGKKNGWLVWLYSSKDSDLNKSADLSLTCFNRQIEVSKEAKVEIDSPKEDNVIGGIYVVPVVTGVGCLEFRLCGIMVKSADKWSLQFPFVGNDGSKSNVKEKQDNNVKAEQKDSLTPVNDDMYPAKTSKKKNKKNKK